MGSDLECQNPVKEVVGGMGSGLIGLHLKDTLQDEVFGFFHFSIWLTLGGPIPPGSARSQMSKHWQHRK